MTITEIEKCIKSFINEDKKLCITSSFQSHSIPLLHILSIMDIRFDVLFINTGFHFPETLSFKNTISRLLNLNVINVESKIPKILQLDSEKHFYYSSDPDYCCYLNKTQPLEEYLQVYDIWINGIRKEQSKQRAMMNIFEDTPFKAIRFHPLLDWDDKMINDYRVKYKLPSHPLEEQGYRSIGCEPCTLHHQGNDRSNRWAGMNKTECGLHTNLIQKDK